MNRIGTHPEDVEGFLEKLKKYPHIHIHGTFTHMAKADIHDKTTARKQLEKFEEALSHMPQRLEKGFIISAANSAGVLDMPESWYNLARPGIILYGPHPSDEMDNMWDLGIRCASSAILPMCRFSAKERRLATAGHM